MLEQLTEQSFFMSNKVGIGLIMTKLSEPLKATTKNKEDLTRLVKNLGPNFSKNTENQGIEDFLTKLNLSIISITRRFMMDNQSVKPVFMALMVG
jgi:hypothetical protein